MSQNKSRYNYAILGSNLEALWIGAYLKSKGQRVVLIDEASRLGGVLAPVEFQGVAIDALDSDLPRSETLLSVVTSLNATLPLLEPLAEFPQNKISFEKGNFEPFVGFGENSPDAFDLFTGFLQESKINLRMPLSQLFTRLSEGLEIRLNSVFSDILIANKKILSLTVNEKERIEADHYIFTKNPVELLEIMPADIISPKTVSKLSKFKAWATINLTLVHKNPIAETNDLHILYGTQKNPVVSVGKLGRVFNAQSEPVFYSQWTSFLEQDTEDLSEVGVQALKEMKRQIKRAYPNAFEDIVFEKIALLENVHATIDLGSKIFGTLSELENLTLSSHQMISETSNRAASALMAAEKTVTYLDVLLNRTASSVTTESSEAPQAPDAQL